MGVDSGSERASEVLVVMMLRLDPGPSMKMGVGVCVVRLGIRANVHADICTSACENS